MTKLDERMQLADDMYARKLGAYDNMRAALEAALKPGEPVAWMHEDELPESYPYDLMYPHSKVDGVRMFPVFTHPPRREPLADEQIADIAINQKRLPPHDYMTILLTGPGVDYKKFRSAGESGWVTLEDLILYTRAIEQAHGIGEKT